MLVEYLMCSNVSVTFRHGWAVVVTSSLPASRMGSLSVALLKSCAMCVDREGVNVEAMFEVDW